MSRSVKQYSFLLSLAIVGTIACRRENGEVREWTRADHDNQGKPSAGQIDPAAPRPEMPSLKEHGVDDVILATWKQNCIACHGVIGRGDGPQGAMLKPPNFTDPEWQRVHLDEEMGRAIQKGRGKMPAFSQLPPETIKGLVQLIRLLNPNRHEQGDASAKAGKEPSPAAPSSTGGTK